MTWVQSQLDDEAVFPSELGSVPPLPPPLAIYKELISYVFTEADMTNGYLGVVPG
jgi:hypothetical protein